MKIFRKSTLFVVLTFLFISCSSKDDASEMPEEIIPQNVVISGYVNSILWEPIDPTNPISNHIWTGNVTDSKINNVTFEYFENDISSGISTREFFSFTNDNLSTYSHRHPNQADRDVSFYFENENLVGINVILSASIHYHRIVHISETEIYFERVSLPYNDPNSEITERRIVYFDDNENVIKAGKDVDMDGVLDTENTFSYVNNNLVSIQMHNGQTTNFEYSSVIDSMSYLNTNTFGKKVYRLYSSETYASQLIQNISNLHHSYNVKLQDLQVFNYEIHSNNFYSRKTKITDETDTPFPYNLRRTETTEFTFQ